MAADTSFVLEGPLAKRGARQPYESLVLTTTEGDVQRIRRGSTVLVNGRRATAQRTHAHAAAPAAARGSRLAGRVLTRQRCALVRFPRKRVLSSSEDSSDDVSLYVAYVREVYQGKRGADPQLSVYWRVPQAAASAHTGTLRRLCAGVRSRARAPGCTGRTKHRASQTPPRCGPAPRRRRCGAAHLTGHQLEYRRCF